MSSPKFHHLVKDACRSRQSSVWFFNLKRIHQSSIDLARCGVILPPYLKKVGSVDPVRVLQSSWTPSVHCEGLNVHTGLMESSWNLIDFWWNLGEFDDRMIQDTSIGCQYRLQMGPSWPKDEHNRPMPMRMEFKLVPGWRKLPSTCPEVGPSWPQYGPRTPHVSAKIPPSRPKMDEVEHKTA